MNKSNELFELCKQVYEVTGWRGEDGFITTIGDKWIKDVKKRWFDETIDSDGFYPLYTSDYLLEKLPATVKNDFDGGNDYIILYKKGKSWYADYMGQFKRQKSDTPLKALLKLALKLHEEKIL